MPDNLPAVAVLTPAQHALRQQVFHRGIRGNVSQQGGLVAYVDDDLFTRFSSVAIWNTRQTEFGKEMPFADRLSYGGTIVGPPAETTWLRLTHRVDPGNGEHELRAWSSRDGRTWVKGGVWTLPAGADVKVGLVAHGNTPDGGAQGLAEFDYFRLYR